MNEGEKIQKELENIAPEIQWNRQRPDFNIPEGYFQQTEKDILARIQIEEAEKTLTRQPAYQVPEGYFQELPQQVLETIHSGHQVKLLPRYRRQRSNWPVAAAIAILVGVAGLLSISRQSTAPSFNNQLAGIGENALEQYLDIQTSTLNMEDTYDQQKDDDPQDDNIAKEFTSAEIKAYLDNNVFSPSGL